MHSMYMYSIYVHICIVCIVMHIFFLQLSLVLNLIELPLNVSARKLGRPPTAPELFVHTQTKNGDGKTFINEKSKNVNVNYSIT